MDFGKGIVSWESTPPWNNPSHQTHLKMDLLTQKERHSSSSNHPFSGAFVVRFRESSFKGCFGWMVPPNLYHGKMLGNQRYIRIPTWWEIPGVSRNVCHSTLWMSTSQASIKPLTWKYLRIREPPTGKSWLNFMTTQEILVCQLPPFLRGASKNAAKKVSVCVKAIFEQISLSFASSLAQQFGARSNDC